MLQVANYLLDWFFFDIFEEESLNKTINTERLKLSMSKASIMLENGSVIA